MVRPKVKETKQQFTVMLKPSTVKEIDKLAEKLEMSRSQFMANLIETGLDDAKTLDKVGMLSLFRAGGKLAAKLKNKFLSGKAKVDDSGDLKIEE